MFLIMSAAYISQELESEFGKIPPSFLPLGNRRLFQHQIQSIPSGEKVFLSLPEKFMPDNHDLDWLNSHNVTILKIPEGLTLGASLVSTLNLAEDDHKSSLSILFGDTLLPELPVGENIISISKVEFNYHWAIVNKSNTDWLNTRGGSEELDFNNVVCGYFNFEQPKKLLIALTMAHWDFIESLNFYHKECGLNTVQEDNWLDFGHLNTYYRSKAKFTTQRAFNSLEITPHWIRKSSSNTQKIIAEANWFEQIPADLRIYLPQYLGSKIGNDGASYKLEYLHFTALNELFVFSVLPELVWRKIFDNCLSFIRQCQSYEVQEGNNFVGLKSLFYEKTISRLNQYCQSYNCQMDTVWQFNGEFNASFDDLLLCSKKFLPIEGNSSSVIHGDFCFSNILYDFRTNIVKAIDPRGIDLNEDFTIYGDTHYDVAKLSHSVLGLYDWIMAGYYNVQINQHDIQFKIDTPESIKGIQQLFLTLINDRFKLTSDSLYAMQIHLFLSMLPLHADDKKRQQALMANAFRLYQIIKEA
ncbi:MAG: hypothetical protein ACJA0H_001406 [Francisellaceae bacterium]|jgi:hypothetical protein